MNVLIIEDQPLTADSYKLFLEHHYPDWEFYIANSYSSADQVIRDKAFHFALIDIKIPKNDETSTTPKEDEQLLGFEVAQKLRNSSLGHLQAILFFSADSTLRKNVDKIILEFKKLNNTHGQVRVGYLPKGQTRPEEMIKVIDGLLNTANNIISPKTTIREHPHAIMSYLNIFTESEQEDILMAYKKIKAYSTESQFYKVLRHVAKGYAHKDITNIFEISTRAVEAHITTANKLIQETTQTQLKPIEIICHAIRLRELE
jgi:DNA-binding NarL/FixJ family response regulator